MGNLYISLFVILLCVVSTYGACSRDTYTNLPSAPVFPTANAVTPAATATNPVTTGHWSEAAKLNTFRTPFQRVPTANPSQTDCPHKQQDLKDWHDASTWGSSGVPANGASVTIPAGTKVLISSCSIDQSWAFGLITVPQGSALIFGDADIKITATGFNVDGALFAGSATCRLRSKITITLTGSRPQTVPALPYVKGISVQGTIDFHGALYTPTWTRLAMTAKPGDTVIYVQDVVNWQAGQLIAITTTELKDTRDWHRNEERIIKSVKLTAYDGVSAVELTEALAYKHFGGREYQAEVALLSRNIVVQGSAADSEPTDKNVVCKDVKQPWADAPGISNYPCEKSYLTGWGAHIFVNGAAAEGRFAGVEMFRVGQTNSLGRYPIHFHQLLQIQSSNYGKAYVRDSSVHRSYFRCYAIHGTSGALLTENTAYDAIGHCYFLEDGVEEDNIISYNQAAFVQPLGQFWNPSIESPQEKAAGGSFYSQYLAEYTNTPDLILPSDMAAGCFYITNTYNDIYGNAASGGFAGFAIPSLRFPVKLYNAQANKNWSPAVRPFRTAFRGNSAHSTGYWWASAGGIYVGGELRQDGTATDGTLRYTSGRSRTRDTCTDIKVTTPAGDGGCWYLDKQLWLRFEDNKVFLANRGLQNWGDRSELIRFEFHDVALSMNVFGAVWIDQMLMECRTKNNALVILQGCNITNMNDAWRCSTRDQYFFTTIGGFQWYDVSQKHILTNSIFRNCREDHYQCLGGKCENTAVFTSLSHSDQFVPQRMQVTNKLTYDNCGAKWRFSTPVATAPFVTVSGRDQNWYDYDGSASGLGSRAMIGSARAREWWKYDTDCVLENEAYKCPLKAGDSAASLEMWHNYAQESRIGIGGSNALCLNGGGNGGANCPIVAKISHFGITNENIGFELATNPRVTGPIINARGGWFVRFNEGTPALINITSIQVHKEDVLILALPYPANTKFEIWNQGATWCNPQWDKCRQNYTQVNSIADVRSAYGDAYYWNNAAKILYLRVVSAESTFNGLTDAGGRFKVFDHADKFVRAGLEIYTDSYQSYVYIKANCGGFYCAKQDDVAVPTALNLPPPAAPPVSIATGTISQPAASIASPATITTGAASTSAAASSTVAGISSSTGTPKTSTSAAASSGAPKTSTTSSNSATTGTTGPAATPKPTSGSSTPTPKATPSPSSTASATPAPASSDSSTAATSGSSPVTSGTPGPSTSSKGSTSGSSASASATASTSGPALVQDPNSVKSSAVALSSSLLFALIALVALMA